MAPQRGLYEGLPVSALDRVATRWDLLRHPFYRRWVEGTLTRAELADYSGQYAHVVAGLPRWLSAANGDGRLQDHVDEEKAHVELWSQFRDVVGGEENAIPNSTTESLVSMCDSLADAGHGLAVAWAIEVQAPGVSREKLSGLKEHYAIDAKSGGQYFEIHSWQDLEHANQLRKEMKEESGEYALADMAAAEAVSAGIWALLSSVEARAHAEAAA